jgi:hypothetical protein
MVAPIPNPKHIRIINRRSVLVGASLCVICAPAIVRATSLMLVRELRSPTERLYAGFVQRLFLAALYNNLGTGRMTVNANGKIISEVDARRMVARARVHGWLPPGAAYSQSL